MTLSKVQSVCALAAMAACVSGAMADVSTNLFELEVCQNGICVAEYFVPSDGTWDENAQAWVWSAGADLAFPDPADPENPFALMGEDTAITIQPAIAGVRSDPVVELNFVMTAGLEDTEFTITSSELFFAPMVNPIGRSEAGINVTDRYNSDGVTLWATAGNDGVSFANYNGLIPAGTEFAELLQNDLTAGPWGSYSENESTGDVVINDTVSSMSAQIKFMITAGDLASGSSTFTIVPEPSSLCLLAVLALIRRR